MNEADVGHASSNDQSQINDACRCGDGCSCAGTKGFACDCKSTVSMHVDALAAAAAVSSTACKCGSGCDCAGTAGGACQCGSPAQEKSTCSCGAGCDCVGSKGGKCGCGTDSKKAAGGCTCESTCDCAGTKGGECGCGKTEGVAKCNCGPGCDCAGSKGGECGCGTDSKKAAGGCNCGSTCDCAGTKGGECGCGKTEGVAKCNCGPGCDCAGTKGGACDCGKSATKEADTERKSDERISENKKPRLIYFNQRGRAEVIRLMLAEAQVDYIDYRFPANSLGDSSSNQEFEAMRASGRLDWDQVPAFEVDGQLIVQSRAIERYIASRYALVSKDPIEAAHADSVCEALTDISLALQRIVTGSTESRKEAMKDFVDVQLPKWGGLFEAKLRRCGTGFYGKSCSYADISAYYLWNMIDQHSAGYALKLFPAIKAHTVLIGACYITNFVFLYVSQSV